MNSFRVLILLTAFLFSGPGQARLLEPPKLQESCQHAGEGLGDDETTVWMAVCKTGYADSEQLHVSEISGKFLKAILSEDIYTKNLPSRGLTFKGFVVAGHANLSYAHIPSKVEFLKMTFQDELSFANSRVDGPLIFEDTQFLIPANFNGSHIKGDVLFDNIVGSLSAINAIVDRQFLIINSLSKTDNVINLTGGHFNRLFMSNVSFKTIFLSETRVDTNVALRDAAVKLYLDMRFAKIEGNLLIVRSGDNTKMLADSMHVKGWFLLEKSPLQTLVAPRLQVDGIFYLNVYGFGSSSIGNDSDEWDGGCPTSTQWKGDTILERTTSSIDLRDAHIGTIASPISLASWPTFLYINGLTYDVIEPYTFEPLDPNADDDSGELALMSFPTDWYRCWLKRSRARFTHRFEAQPYRQMVTYLKNHGEETAAVAISIEGKNGERRQACQDGPSFWVYCAYLVLSWLLVGYGYRMYLPICFSIALCLVGWFVIRNAKITYKSQKLGGGPALRQVRRKSKHKQNPLGLAYSFDMLIPLVKLQGEHYTDVEVHGAAKYYFYFHKVAGWVLSFYILAAFAELSK